MTNVLIVSQKELTNNSMFRQDKYLLDMYSALKSDNNIKILYLNKAFKSNDENDKKENNIDIEQFCIRDILKGNQFKEKIVKFVVEHEINTIVFMSPTMAKLIIPCVINEKNINIITDFRISNLSAFLKEYSMKETKNNHKRLQKNFKFQMFQIMAILKYSDYILLDKGNDISLLEKEGVKNVINFENIEKYVSIKNKQNLVSKTNAEIAYLSINQNNFLVKNNKTVYEIDKNKYVIYKTKGINLIDEINKTISNSSCDYICIYNDKLTILPKTIDLLIENISLNDKIAVASPISFFSREVYYLKDQFINQRINNFSNWEEAQPISFSDCIVIKRQVFNKIGFFDNKFMNIEYAIFDFILRLYMVRLYYCVMHDISIFKSQRLSYPISKQDKDYLCDKWGEYIFNMGI